MYVSDIVAVTAVCTQNFVPRLCMCVCVFQLTFVATTINVKFSKDRNDAAAGYTL